MQLAIFSPNPAKQLIGFPQVLLHVFRHAGGGLSVTDAESKALLEFFFKRLQRIPNPVAQVQSFFFAINEGF